MKQELQSVPMQIIARIQNDFPTKFGIPRQSGLVESLQAQIVFEPPYRNADALRGLEAFSHIWLIWQFSEAVRETWSPTVRPPRLGGNTRMGVFATRSPFRPNAIGLSSVKLEKILWDTPQGAVLVVSGADLMHGTPIFDIKPYLPYADCHADAAGGFTQQTQRHTLEVHFPQPLWDCLPESLRQPLHDVLAQDPRPAYQNDPKRVYGFVFGGYEIQFTAADGLLTVQNVQKYDGK